jgi:GGDEF domain-containing protein
MDGSDLPRRPTRPVADAPTADAVALTKSWLVALVTRAPLHSAVDVPAAALARGGPSLCAALVAALGTDREIERLAGLAPGVAALSGAKDPAGVVRAVEALRAVTWEALAPATEPEPGLAGLLGDRLAHLCALVCEVAVGAAPSETSPTRAVAATGAASPPNGVRVVTVPAAPVERDPLMSLADELSVAAHDAFATPEREPAPLSPDVPNVRRRRAVGWDDDAATAPPWLAAIVRRLEQREQDGQPFAVLVAEVDGLDRLLAAQAGREVAAALEAAERGLTHELAASDLVVRERLGRWWLTSPGRGPAAARELAGRVAAAIGGAVLAGVPLAASVGHAACPQDGEDLEALAGRADEAMFAARAAGVPVADH